MARDRERHPVLFMTPPADRLIDKMSHRENPIAGVKDDRLVRTRPVLETSRWTFMGHFHGSPDG